MILVLKYLIQKLLCGAPHFKMQWFTGKLARFGDEGFILLDSFAMLLSSIGLSGAAKFRVFVIFQALCSDFTNST